jgi:tRNA/rRNA methyltransferase
MNNRPVIILVEPQLGENVGFVARSMNNFGFNELRIVNPRDGWPNPAAEATAVKAINIVRSAQIFPTFAEATADLAYLYATSARSRDFNKEEISSKNIVVDLQASCVESNKIGFVFGPERSGLDNDIISRVNKLVYIPTNSESPSINIAISVAILCYELVENPDRLYKSQHTATQAELENLFYNIEIVLDQKNFYKVPEKKQKMLQNIRNIFKRVPNFSSSEVSTLIGIFKSLLPKAK